MKKAVKYKKEFFIFSLGIMILAMVFFASKLSLYMSKKSDGLTHYLISFIVENRQDIPLEWVDIVLFLDSEELGVWKCDPDSPFARQVPPGGLANFAISYSTDRYVLYVKQENRWLPGYEIDVSDCKNDLVEHVLYFYVENGTIFEESNHD